MKMHFVNCGLFILNFIAFFALSSSKYVYNEFVDKGSRLADYEKNLVERNPDNKLGDSQYLRYYKESVADKIEWIKRHPNRFQNFLIHLNFENSYKSKRETQINKSLQTYPEVVTNTLISNIPNPIPAPIPASDAVLSYGSFLNFVDQSDTSVRNNSMVEALRPQSIGTSLPAATNNNNGTECSRFLSSDNATAVLEKVLEELELIRKAKEGNSTPDGAPCDIIGSWNSEVIGLRFDISSLNNGSNELVVKLNEHNPPKRHTLINTNWTSSGYSLKEQGGPFYLLTAKNKEDTMATFTGVCKNCGNTDTIFGTWSIVHPAKDCKDLQMAIETKRDIFRRESVHIRKQEKLSKIKNNSKNENNFL